MEQMYPEMIEIAKAEGKREETSFHYANEVEKIHSKLYRSYQAALALVRLIYIMFVPTVETQWRKRPQQPVRFVELKESYS